MFFLDRYESVHRVLVKLIGSDPWSEATLDCGVFQEQSIPEQLCKNPLVSVHMITYNHENWIGEAIESVVGQQGDFELELIIAEDSSTDRTREICFDYQRRYPDKIRVLYGSQNERGRRSDARIFAAARGKYIAYLEGDDYWSDPHKLEKQLALMKRLGAEGCVGAVDILKNGKRQRWRIAADINSDRLLSEAETYNHYFHTSTAIFERELFERVRVAHQNLGFWYDTMRLNFFREKHAVAYLNESTSVYRITGSGIASSLTGCQYATLAFRQWLIQVNEGGECLRHCAARQLLTKLVQCALMRYSAGDSFQKGVSRVTLLDRLLLYRVAIRLSWTTQGLRSGAPLLYETGRFLRARMKSRGARVGRL